MDKIIDILISKNIELSFSNYFKFSFNFQGKYDHYTIYASCGGSADDIYSLSIEPNSKMILSKNNFYYISVTNTQTGETVSWDY